MVSGTWKSCARETLYEPGEAKRVRAGAWQANQRAEVEDSGSCLAASSSQSAGEWTFWQAPPRGRVRASPWPAAEHPLHGTHGGLCVWQGSVLGWCVGFWKPLDRVTHVETGWIEETSGIVGSAEIDEIAVI